MGRVGVGRAKTGQGGAGVRRMRGQSGVELEEETFRLVCKGRVCRPQTLVKAMLSCRCLGT
ncbi:hypothetical protein E2C01_071064 [Portunus trituberculatus]|uniref:Uncharacterized protein n=1 Tax=Portunus trituberculatus TaxID=210409 RepID=A0A5B7I3B9_PORTR|nr:hypothetical protein [Portunus trituberculatus]